ncbi:uncharacterized protein [Battus philenor]|uniref:uncharacterized protein n=1 Tax=Battus philenor TaxID=42288 RepID=UPI0035CF15F8
MEGNLNKGSTLSISEVMTPTDFDVATNTLLISLNAEKYIDIFRKRNIGQCTLVELTEEDLIKLGVKEGEIRQKLLEEIKNLPIYEECKSVSKVIPNLGPMEIVEVLEESSQHLYRIHLSVLANTLAVKKTKKISDCLLYKDKYASDIALSTLSEIISVLNSMDLALHTHFKALTKTTNKSRNKKLLVGAVGSAVIAMLTVLFVKSLKDLQ